jgi:hypothetical protein
MPERRHRSSEPVSMHISSRQAKVLQKPVVDGFPARASRFLQDEYPELARQVGPQAFDALVAHGQQRAVLHGFTSERHIVRYLLLMLYLGPRFDEDPTLATLQPFLDAQSTMSPEWRLHVLFGAARRRPEPGARGAH